MATMEEKRERTYDLVGGALCLDFVNTRGNYIDKLNPTYDYFESYADILSWARQAGVITREEQQALDKVAEDRPQETESAFRRAKELRESIQRTFLAASEGLPPETHSFDLLNSHIAEAMCHARVEHTQDGYQWGWESAEGNLERILWPIARSAADLLISNKLARVHECAGDTCGWMFIDTSKNHSRRWCDMKDCGNTAKARRYYRRKVQGKLTEA